MLLLAFVCFVASCWLDYVIRGSAPITSSDRVKTHTWSHSCAAQQQITHTYQQVFQQRQATFDAIMSLTVYRSSSPIILAVAATAEEILQDIGIALRWAYKRVLAIRSAWFAFLVRQKLLGVPTFRTVVRCSKASGRAVRGFVSYCRSEEGQYQMLQRSARPLAMLSALAPLIIAIAVLRAMKDDQDGQWKPLFKDTPHPPVQRPHLLPFLKRRVL